MHTSQVRERNQMSGPGGGCEAANGRPPRSGAGPVGAATGSGWSAGAKYNLAGVLLVLLGFVFFLASPVDERPSVLGSQPEVAGGLGEIVAGVLGATGAHSARIAAGMDSIVLDLRGDVKPVVELVASGVGVGTARHSALDLSHLRLVAVAGADAGAAVASSVDVAIHECEGDECMVVAKTRSGLGLVVADVPPRTLSHWTRGMCEAADVALALIVVRPDQLPLLTNILSHDSKCWNAKVAVAGKLSASALGPQWRQTELTPQTHGRSPWTIFRAHGMQSGTHSSTGSGPASSSASMGGSRYGSSSEGWTSKGSGKTTGGGKGKPGKTSSGGNAGRLKPKPRPYKHMYKDLVFWSNDFHISPTKDVKHLFAEWGIKVIEKSLSGHCHMTGSCASDLKVLSKHNGMNLNGGDGLKAKFFDAYKADPIMASVDAFLCFHPSSMCELFMPFNKSLIVAPSTRFELGREEPGAWTAWIKNVRRIASKKQHRIISNNAYDAEYVKYFTGLDEVKILPSFCNYTGVMYAPEPTTHPELLSGKILQGAEMVRAEIAAANKRAGTSVVIKDVREVYPGHYEYADLVKHPALVYPAPYQLSTMSIFEAARMAMPMFFPSVKFLVDLDLQHGVVNQRTFKRVYTGQREAKSDVARHPQYTGTHYDPNDEVTREAMEYWFQYGDFYQWPNIVHYDSWDDLIAKIESTDLDAVSAAMRKDNERVLFQLKEDWMDIFDAIIEARGGDAKAAIPQGSWSEAMNALWG
ncbi:uncharacterized protein AMSG_09924 [Thecamonas trahens ATCC 50062]|uniref:Uncharacterized protein n=1 Tax=Thecamonas trahens ATCC 50062 TaxID=461836 RepID=A0A0L0DPF9_THETB|nr:hypothetical protein AMSG_09924 [Thecamonas trahens ATCC 50062]KNC54145.1 hypothetical protein AMSG_09924 [Thecamonas trahens ATCC 50062]|eukprot:XP_013753966.1 hypothetical protein AMSG_09924 [Thecamonas trahens ATCC 50062]